MHRHETCLEKLLLHIDMLGIGFAAVRTGLRPHAFDAYSLFSFVGLML